MPVYEFECRDCNENFEKLIRIVGRQDVVCPKCASTNTRKKLSVFASGRRGASATGGDASCAPGGT
jgi:putative FmdB family regulatory protein